MLAGLVVGVVESVAPDQIRASLELDSPHATALNTGTPTPFPRLNAYVVLPNEAGATVGYIAWMGIERSPFPRRNALKDFGLVDLPFPVRKMSIIPVGTLTVARRRAPDGDRYELSRGVVAFPSVGDQVLIPTPEQIAAIVGAQESDRRVCIGVSPMASNAPICVNPDKLFGRHLAVLGNTGSGKSCSVAGIIRWSLDAAKTAIEESGASDVPNARFIVLDPNGEYSRAFADQGDALRVFRVPPLKDGESPLSVPAWLWNAHEWTAVAQAQPGAQRPLLLQGIRELKNGNTADVPRAAFVRRYLLQYATRLASMLADGPKTYAGLPAARFGCARVLVNLGADCLAWAEPAEGPLKMELESLSTAVNAIVEGRRSGNYFNDFSISELDATCKELRRMAAPLPDLSSACAVGEDAPRQFDVGNLADHLERMGDDRGGNVAAFVSTLGLRIRSMMADQQLANVIGGKPPVVFEQWLETYLGADGASNGSVAVLDLSLVPSEVVHIVVAVLARLVFEALQRYRRVHTEGRILPTVLVLEEAHTFARRGHDSESGASNPAQLCRETFERIAREGRKFGLGLVVSSQRPSELSPTLLAQCNSFLLHRIVNDADQELVAKLVPDNVGGLLRELPSLPSSQAILLGWATPLPVLVQMNELPKAQQPLSDDPDFWDVWTRKAERAIDWSKVAKEWGAVSESEADDAGQ